MTRHEPNDSNVDNDNYPHAAGGTKTARSVTSDYKHAEIQLAVSVLNVLVCCRTREDGSSVGCFFVS